MSRKQKLSKKIAHTILAMSIVYSGGMNVLCNTAFAAAADGADGNDSIQTGIVIGDGGYNQTFTGTAGGDGSDTNIAGEDSGNGGKGGNASASGTITAQDTGNDITLTVTGGAGGKGGKIGNNSLSDEEIAALGDHTGHGGDGGSAKIALAVQDVQTKVLNLTAKGGVGGEGQNSYAKVTEFGDGGKGGDAAITIKVAGTGFQAESITLSAQGGNATSGGITPSDPHSDKSIGGAGGKGGDAQNEGLVLSGDAANVVVAANIKITGKGGNGADTASVYGISGAGGIAGAANVYGLTCAEAGVFTAEFADLVIEAEGGKGGNTSNTRVDDHSPDSNVKVTAAAAGGAANAYGVNISGGQLTVSGANINSTANGGKAGDGSNLPKYTNNDVTGLGENSGGQAIAAGVKGSGGLLKGTLTGKITARAIGGAGGKGHSMDTDAVINGTNGTSTEPNGSAGKDALGSGLAGGSGGNGYAAAISMAAGSADITVTALEAMASGGSNSDYVGNGGTGGTGGFGGSGSTDSTSGNGGNGKVGSMGGNGGTGYAAALHNKSKDTVKIAAGSILAQAQGGNGGIGGTGGIGGNGGSGENGINNGNGGDGGDGGTGGDGGKGGTGGSGYAAGLYNSQGGKVVVITDSITANAFGGQGGKGGYGSSGGRNGYGGNGDGTGSTGNDGNQGNQGIGGDGGIGGNAYSQGVYGNLGSITSVSADLIKAVATGGNGGNAGSGGANGNAGSLGAEAKAYGIYAESGAVVNLSAKTLNGTIKIGAKANNATTKEAYAVYADKATVLFYDKATLNTSDGSTMDNNVLTSLNNATMGFSGTAANRTVTGGKLQLTGSNAFRFTTDLANGKADSMTFDTIENNSSKQYIQIGYEEAFKDALSKEDIVTINGSATVLTVTNLNGQNLNNFTGQASRLDSPLERFKVTPTVDVVDNKVNITEIALAKENSPSETAMAASDAQMAMGSMWRIEGNNLMKRMGELRSDKEAAKGGVWARYYRGELSADSAYDREFSQDYTAFQGGIDKVQNYKGGKLYTGIAVNRIDSNAGYTAGSGDLSSTGVGLYASWLGSKGHYFDVIARGSKLSNDFKLVDLSGNSAKADYDTWAYGISAEYGYRQNLNAGWFVEPQAELSLGRINSADYTTSNGVTIKQDSVNSAIVRLGFLGGKEFTIGGRTSNAYVKASALHDFGGNGGATGYYENSSLALQTGDLTGTWYEIGLGSNLGIAKNSNLYFDALKTFGGNLRTDWQFNAGLRFTF